MKRRIIFALGVLIVATIAFFIGGLCGDMQQQSHSAYALKKTGLPSEYAPVYELHGFTGSRDSFMQTEFLVQYEADRESLLSEIKRTKNWHWQPVTAAQYQRFQSAYMWDYGNVLSIPNDIVFDAWYFLETAGPVSYSEGPDFENLLESGYVGRGFEFAVFDVQSGLFIFVDQFG
jgi:hypothetical protein